MHVLFEEDGSFRAGAVLADNTTSLQVELPGGRRIKVKAASLLLRFAAPSPAELIAAAESAAEGIDIEFLWEVSPEAEFGFEELAAEYHGARPDPVQAAGVLLRLHSAPMYFHRKGRGRFRRAPPDILQAALAGLERKKQQAAQVGRMAAELVAGRLPAEFPPLLADLLYKPDRNRLETKALEAACAETGQSAPHLLNACGAIASTHDYHLGRFFHDYFPPARGGTGFPAWEPPVDPADLPSADVAAFSIDDAQTTEIDDAFSLVRTETGFRVGIHIAAPGLGFGPDSALGRIARQRLSTVYMPGRKITMLPEEVVERFTLAAGRTVPAISLYVEVAADFRILGRRTVIERVPVAANLRHHDIEPLFNAATLAAGLPDFPYRDELKTLFELAQVLAAGRGDTGANRQDYAYEIDWDRPGADGIGHVAIVPRPRGSPLDVLVAELMILANSTWGALLRDAGIPALYRVQTAGKVRMSTVAAAHEGLGVDCYAWSSSPLRRHCDLINQWQLEACLRGETPPFPPKSGDLLAALRDFELTYAAYAEFQRGMERWWCLRWLRQENVTTAPAMVLRESLVRLEAIPLVLRLPSLPELPRGKRVLVAIDGIDLLDAEIRARFLELLPDAPIAGDLADDGAE